MADRILANKKIKICWDSIVTNIEGVKGNAVTGVSVKNRYSDEETTIPCKGAFIAIGHIPNTQGFAAALKTDVNGYFLVNPGSQVKTDVDGVCVAGDCVDHVYRQAITAAGMGCQAAIDAEKYLAEREQF